VNMIYNTNTFKDPFVVTPKKVLARKIELAEIESHHLVADLGCGDASTLIAAVQKGGCKAIGVEYDKEVYQLAVENVKKAGLSDSIELILGDMYELDISEVDILIIYFTRFSLGELSLHLEQKLKSGCKIITHDFDLPAWEHIHYEKVALPLEKEIFVYRQK